MACRITVIIEAVDESGQSFAKGTAFKSTNDGGDEIAGAVAVLGRRAAAAYRRAVRDQWTRHGVAVGGRAALVSALVAVALSIGCARQQSVEAAPPRANHGISIPMTTNLSHFVGPLGRVPGEGRIPPACTQARMDMIWFRETHPAGWTDPQVRAWNWDKTDWEEFENTTSYLKTACGESVADGQKR